MDCTDKTKAVREGEGFEVKRVEAFLKDSIPGLDGQLEVSQFPGGFSNLTYLIKIGERELVFRRPPFGTKAKSAHDMGREYRVLKQLKPVFPYCPRPLLFCEDESVIGCPFIVMERLKGVLLRKELPPGLAYTPDQARKLCENILDVHVALHKVDYIRAGLEDFGKPEGYVQRQVEGWSERYRQARTPDAPDYEKVMTWLADKMPGDSGIVSVIHNDYKLDNILLKPDQPPIEVQCVLDWEMATVGDPLMDLGGTLAFWVDRDDPPILQAVSVTPTNKMEGAMTRKELVERYCEKMGISIEHIDYYHVFGLFRLSVIIQQIYYRFYHGQTKDVRFKPIVIGVHALEEAAQKVIAQSDL
ncbi:MAG: phosphotransferase family protein [Syntrophaceae bacterium]|nr:phosphotransferase family protein [Syntrophaceae bacterium]